MEKEKESEDSIRSVEINGSDGNEDNKPTKTETNQIKEENTFKQNEKTNSLKDEPKSLGTKSRSTSSIQREGRYVTQAENKKKPKDNAVSNTTQTIKRPFKIILDLCDPIRHWYGQIFIALGIVLTALLVIILLIFGGYWD